MRVRGIRTTDTTEGNPATICFRTLRTTIFEGPIVRRVGADATRRTTRRGRARPRALAYRGGEHGRVRPVLANAQISTPVARRFPRRRAPIASARPSRHSQTQKMHSPAYSVSQIAPLPPSPVSFARREPRSPLRVDVARADDLPHEGASPKKRTPRNSKSGKSPKSPMKSPQSSPYAEQRFGEMLSSVDRRSSDASVRGGDRDAARGGGGVGGSSPDGDAGGRRLSAVERVAQSAEDDAQLAGGVTAGGDAASRRPRLERVHVRRLARLRPPRRARAVLILAEAVPDAGGDVREAQERDVLRAGVAAVRRRRESLEAASLRPVR